MPRDEEQTGSGLPAYARSGRLVIFRTACHHAGPCGRAVLFHGRAAHIEGVALVDDRAAAQLDLFRPLADDCGEAWHVFATWEEAEAWLGSERCPRAT